MTPEEYQRIKEAEKEHLRALRKLRKAVRDLERSKSIASSVTRMGSSSESVLDTHRELVDKLAMETARYEARLEVALDSAGEDAEKMRQAEELERMDAELQKERARGLVDRIRGEIQAGDDVPEPNEGVGGESDNTEVRTPRSKSAAAESPGGKLPEKTIGRMHRGKEGTTSD